MQRITLKNIHDCVSFRYAQLDDLDELMTLYERFFAESVYKDFAEFEPLRARSVIAHGIETRIRPHPVAIVEGRIVGFISWEMDPSFSKKPVAVLFELYVEPEHRRSAIGRFLMGFAVLTARDQGACAFHAPIASGLPETRSLKNMLAKAGFTEFGYLMRKGL